MHVQVLGPGCQKCDELARRTEDALRELSINAEVEKVTKLNEIAAFGVMMTPALVIDGQVKVVGKVPSRDEIVKLLSSK